jgi:hypothetical protein
MTGFAYPEALVRTVALHRAGKVDEAEDLFDRYIPILRHEQQPGFGLAVRKYVLMRRGAMATAATRAPGPSLSKEDIAEVERLMRRLETRADADGRPLRRRRRPRHAWPRSARPSAPTGSRSGGRRLRAGAASAI